MKTPSLLLLACTSGVARAQEGGPPGRTIPPSVLVQLAAIEDRFELALATDCEADLCFSKGCAYTSHSVADRKPSTSLPGLGGEPGPGAVDPQAWLTGARCEFAYEGSLAAGDVGALARRLQTKASSGYTVVSVGSQALPDLPPALHGELPAAELPVEPVPQPDPVAEVSPLRELWNTLLDDFDWMIGLLLGTLAATTLIWAWRRIGRETFEERAMLAELARDAAPPPGEPTEAAPSDEADYVAGQRASWRLRLQGMDPQRPDPEVQAMLRDLLRAGELPLLAKAVLTFPETLPKLFPSGGDIGAAKLALAEHLRTADAARLPSDAELFRALDRHGSSATLAAQRDADVVRSLREEFGAAGLLGLIEAIPPRAGALLFALAPLEAQQELVHLLSSSQMATMSEQLLRSTRMDPAEASYLFDVVRSAGGDAAAIASVPPGEVSDRGMTFDAAGALSTLLPWVVPAERSRLLARLLEWHGGSLPAWYGEIVLPDMLLSMPDEDRADLLLGIDADALAAWLSLQDAPMGERLLDGAPSSLRLSISSSPTFPSRARQVAQADRGRRQLARAFQDQLARRRLPFDQVVRRLGATP